MTIQINNIWDLITYGIGTNMWRLSFWHPNNNHFSLCVVIIGIWWHNIPGMQKNRTVWSCKQQGTPKRGQVSMEHADYCPIQRKWIKKNKKSSKHFISVIMYRNSLSFVCFNCMSNFHPFGFKSKNMNVNGWYIYLSVIPVNEITILINWICKTHIR